MSSDQEYSSEELEKLVQSALAEIEPSEARALFSFGDTGLLPKMYTKLRENLGAAEATVVIDELREDLYGGVHLNKPAQLRSMHGMIKNCKLCPAMQNPQLPKWNLQDPDAVFVGTSPLTGGEGDALFVKALKDSGFRSTRIAYTSVTRCTKKKLEKILPEEIQICSSRYLLDELRLLSPRLIVAMGSVSSSMLLGETTEITQERGEIFWAGPWAILPTYLGGYAFRSDRRKNEFKNDIKKAYEFLYGK